MPAQHHAPPDLTMGPIAIQLRRLRALVLSLHRQQPFHGILLRAPQLDQIYTSDLFLLLPHQDRLLMWARNTHLR